MGHFSVPQVIVAAIEISCWEMLCACSIALDTWGRFQGLLLDDINLTFISDHCFTWLTLSCLLSSYFHLKNVEKGGAVYDHLSRGFVAG